MTTRRTVLVTGGAGFIGSAVVRRLAASPSWRVVVVDKLTYAADRRSLGDAEKAPGFAFEKYGAIFVRHCVNNIEDGAE